MRNFHQAEGVVFLSVCFLSVLITSHHFGKRQHCTDVQDVHLNVGGWGGMFEGRGLCILSHSAFKNCTEEAVWEGRNSRGWLGEKNNNIRFECQEVDPCQNRMRMCTSMHGRLSTRKANVLTATREKKKTPPNSDTLLNCVPSWSLSLTRCTDSFNSPSAQFADELCSLLHSLSCCAPEPPCVLYLKTRH